MLPLGDLAGGLDGVRVQPAVLQCLVESSLPGEVVNTALQDRLLHPAHVGPKSLSTARLFSSWTLSRSLIGYSNSLLTDDMDGLPGLRHLTVECGYLHRGRGRGNQTLLIATLVIPESVAHTLHEIAPLYPATAGFASQLNVFCCVDRPARATAPLSPLLLCTPVPSSIVTECDKEYLSQTSLCRHRKNNHGWKIGSAVELAAVPTPVIKNGKQMVMVKWMVMRPRNGPVSESSLPDDLPTIRPKSSPLRVGRRRRRSPSKKTSMSPPWAQPARQSQEDLSDHVDRV
ncbi:hypothetical protein C8Q76DRAFT_794913 [Earliella scabrosa]|nr:hypothetical protein C8Q76DRAFT_794913 [Earliella scabrosa]